MCINCSISVLPWIYNLKKKKKLYAMLVFINEKVNHQSFNVIKKIWGKNKKLESPVPKKETSSLPSGCLLLDNMN